LTTTETIRSGCECGHEPHEHSADGERLGGCRVCNCKKYLSKQLIQAVKEFKNPPKIANGQEREQLIAIVAEEIMQKHNFVTLLDNMEMRYYEGGIYVEGAEALIHSYIARTLGYQLKNRDRNEVIEHIRHRNHVNRTGFDSELDFINLKNGLLNVRTGELREHDPAYLSLSQLPRYFCPYCSCPKFAKFLVDVLVGDRNKIREAIKMLGYILHRGMEYEKSFMFLGNGGNGKGTFLRVILLWLGSQNCAHESLHNLVSDRFAPAELYLKYVNLFADLKSAKLPDTGPFKMLSSGDPMSAQKKYGKRFNYGNFAKMIFSANNPPDTDDNTYAFYRRWVIFPFDKTYPQNDRFFSELTTEAELTGILNLALKGWRWLKEDGGFSIESVEKIKQDYQYRANNVKRFVDDICIINFAEPEFMTLTDRCYNEYLAFCKKNGFRPLESNTFGSQLVQLGIIHKPKMVQRKRGYYYLGIKLKADVTDGNQTIIPSSGGS